MDFAEIVKQKREAAAKAAEEAQKYELLEKMLDDPDMRQILREQLRIAASEIKPASQEQTSGIGITRLKRVMEERGNTPILIIDLAEAARLSVPTVRQLMTRTQAFKKVQVNESRQGLYVLKDEFLTQK